jgi:hypothetical protein
MIYRGLIFCDDSVSDKCELNNNDFRELDINEIYLVSGQYWGAVFKIVTVAFGVSGTGLYLGYWDGYNSTMGPQPKPEHPVPDYKNPNSYWQLRRELGY